MSRRDSDSGVSFVLVVAGEVQGPLRWSQTVALRTVTDTYLLLFSSGCPFAPRRKRPETTRRRTSVAPMRFLTSKF